LQSFCRDENLSKESLINLIEINSLISKKAIKTKKIEENTSSDKNYNIMKNEEKHL